MQNILRKGETAHKCRQAALMLWWLLLRFRGHGCGQRAVPLGRPREQPSDTCGTGTHTLWQCQVDPGAQRPSHFPTLPAKTTRKVSALTFSLPPPSPLSHYSFLHNVSRNVCGVQQRHSGSGLPDAACPVGVEAFIAVGTAAIQELPKSWFSAERGVCRGGSQQQRLLGKQPRQVGHCWSAGSLPDTRAVPERPPLRKAFPQNKTNGRWRNLAVAWEPWLDCSETHHQIEPASGTRQERLGVLQPGCRAAATGVLCPQPRDARRTTREKARAGLAGIYFKKSPVLRTSHRSTTQQEPPSLSVPLFCKTTGNNNHFFPHLPLQCSSFPRSC